MTDTGDTTGWMDDPLRVRLRALRTDLPPEHDLWPGIAARIAQTPPAMHFGRNRWRTATPWAMAAAVVLAVFLAWQHNATSPRGGSDKLIAREAQGMTREYRGALQVITASAQGDVADTQALRDLDRSAAQIQAALVRDPDARFLLDRLQHTYALRLALTQRAAMS
ncbi:hypothetical protein [Cognatiluteimonas profundi]|uniref:hypothetical protein n=1 Tax=Cognatiluteimonas profundi TaxID=2594501 RepID=UPI00131ECB3F|nr:hypothetical protein [Lysobacter profundi]